MRYTRFVLFLMMLIVSVIPAFGQVGLSQGSSTVSINFSSTTPAAVGSAPGSAYSGAGFEPNPTIAGRLNSNAWSVRGFDFGDLDFGDTQTLDDFGRGSVSTGVITPGLYAYTDAPATVANPTLLIQPGENDFSPGHLVLRIRNNGTINMTQLSVSYNIFVRNDEERSSSFKFSHSTDDVSYTSVSSLDFVSDATPDSFGWSLVDNSPSREIVISGLNVPPGAYYYLRWSINDVGGSGNRDEFGLDDIVISGTFGNAVPNIIVKSVTSYTVPHMDTTPSVSEGTEAVELSTYNSTHPMLFYIENLGAANLNITNVTVTGTHAANFTVYSGGEAGTINAVVTSDNGTTTISQRELRIIFKPTLEGLHKARINIYSNDNTKNPYWFDVQGMGYHPKPDMAVRSAAGAAVMSQNMIPNTGNTTLWGTQMAGVAVQREFRIRNEGQPGAPLLLTGTPAIQIAGDHPDDFVVTQQPSSNSITTGITGVFKITFNPRGNGIRSAIVTIPNNDPQPDVLGNSESPYVFKIQGVGIAPEIEVYGNNQEIVNNSMEPTVTNHTHFEYVNVNSATVTRVYTIKNTSTTAALTVGTPVISGPHASDFTLITSPATSIAMGGQTTFSVRFDPSEVGQRDAIITFSTNDFDENPYTFAIRGNGIDYIPCSFEAVETLRYQNFETTPPTAAWNYTPVNTTLAGLTGYGAGNEAGNSNRFIGARSLQSTNAVGTVIFGSVNTIGYFNTELYMRLGSFATTAAEGADATDRVIVSISTNGGASWSDEIVILGNNQSKWSFLSGSGVITQVYDGDNVVASYTSDAGYATSNGYSHIRLSGLPQVANLQVKVVMQNNSASEVWALDEVQLFGRREVTTTWNGTAWSNGAPNSTTKAVLAGNYSTTSGNIQACKLQVNSGVTLTINSNQFVVAESNLDNAGNIIIENNGSLIQRDDNAQNTGSIVVKRNTTPVRRYDYTYWSSPVVGQTLLALSPNTLSDKYFEFDTQLGNWVNVPSSTVMEGGKGYIVRAPQSHDINTAQVYNAQFNGLAHNGIYTQAVYASEGDWNLLGNPYPSAIDADKFLTLPSNNALTGTLYFWTHNTPLTNYVYTSNDYASYNLLGGAGTGQRAPNSGINNTIPSRYIASGQGFFAIAAQGGSVSFNNGMRQTTNNSAFFRAQDSDATQNEKHRLWLNLSSENGMFRQVLLGYASNATHGIDRLYDGRYISVNSDIAFYSILEGDEFSIQGRGLPFESSDRFILGYRTTLAGTYTVSVEDWDGLFSNQDFYLLDNYTGMTHDIRNAPYVFETETGTFNDRFEIVYQSQALSTIESQTNAGILLAVKNGEVKIKSLQDVLQSVEIYDLLGRTLIQEDNIQNSEILLDLSKSASQAILVKVQLANGNTISRKAVLK